MPPTRTAALVTDGYRRRLIDLRDATALAVAAMLDDVDLDVGPAGVTRELANWRTRATALTAAAGTQASTSTLAYLSAYLMAAGGSPLTPMVQGPEPDASGLSVVRGALLWRLGQGGGRALAMRTATATARRTARDVVGRAATQTLAEGIRRDPQITGWRRVTSASCCQRCADLAGRTFRDNADFVAHSACRCSAEPTLGRPETIRRAEPTVVSP